MRAAEESLPTKSSRPTAAQEFPTAPAYLNWPASMQAYYGSGATLPPFFTSATAPAPSPAHPYLWGSQRPMVSQYGTGLPYPALYPPRQLPYAPSDIATAQHAPLINTATETKASDEKDLLSMDIVTRTSGDADLKDRKSVESLKVASGSENDGASHSDESACASSSEASDENANKEASSPTKKRSFNQLPAYEANATSNGAAQHNRENPLARSMAHLNIERSTASDTLQQLAPLAMVACDGMLHDQHQYIQDEREIKREKRKQSNRESARRSRLRKMAECEELQVRVDVLYNETRTLRDELQSLAEECEKVACENNIIMEELRHFCGPNISSSLLVGSNDAVLCSVNGKPNGLSTECN